jgi:hypothetical protein
MIGRSKYFLISLTSAGFGGGGGGCGRSISGSPTAIPRPSCLSADATPAVARSTAAHFSIAIIAIIGPLYLLVYERAPPVRG